MKYESALSSAYIETHFGGGATSKVTNETQGCIKELVLCVSSFCHRGTSVKSKADILCTYTKTVNSLAEIHLV